MTVKLKISIISGKVYSIISYNSLPSSALKREALHSILLIAVGVISAARF